MLTLPALSDRHLRSWSQFLALSGVAWGVRFVFGTGLGQLRVSVVAVFCNLVMLCGCVFTTCFGCVHSSKTDGESRGLF